MSKDPAFLFYPGDYLRDTQILSESVQVAYDRIMCEHMRNICISQTQLKFLTKRLSKDEKDELFMVLSKVSGGYQITWVAESIEKRRSYSESRRKNREGTKKKICKTYDSHMENENENENIKEIISYLNEKTKKNFRSTTSKTKSTIIARLNEKFVVDDFKKVIDIKTQQWLGDSKMEEFLRPETLFGNKFEGYLNSVPKQKQTPKANREGYTVNPNWKQR